MTQTATSTICPQVDQYFHATWPDAFLGVAIIFGLIAFVLIMSIEVTWRKTK